MPKVKVLLVDDRKENLFSLGILLEELDIDLYKAQSGVEALEMMVDHDFALAILDVQMPDMDGFELAELMRGAQKTQSIPIIFVTAAPPAAGFAFKGYGMGAVDFLYKPLDPMIFRSKVKVFIDLENQKNLLRQAKDAAENANRLKSAFLANMSHEIRTPLGALMGFAELLDDEKLPFTERQKYSRIIKQNGESLTNLIDDILDLSKVEAGHFDISSEEINIVKVTEDIISLLGKSAEQKGLKINLSILNAIPEIIVSDEKRIRQVLTNVIGNAIKFTELGKVDVVLSSEVKSDHVSKLIFKVVDTGIGIEPEKIRKLFKPFTQADNSVTRKFGGTGLGLALSKKLAQLLGGDLVLEKSEPENGSIFIITFLALHKKSFVSEGLSANLIHSKKPEFKAAVELETKQSKATIEELVLHGKKVLVVEDSKDNQTLMDIILRRRGAIPDFANNGNEGFDKALKLNYDIVLMDIQMPVQDGYETVRKLREKNYRTPIIALTAHAMSNEKEKCLQAGCDDFLSKPISQTQLINKIVYYSEKK